MSGYPDPWEMPGSENQTRDAGATASDVAPSVRAIRCGGRRCLAISPLYIVIYVISRLRPGTPIVATLIRATEIQETDR